MKNLKEEEKFLPSGIFEGIVSLRAVLDSIESGDSDRIVERVLFDRSRSEKKARELEYIKKKSREHGFSLVMTDRNALSELTTGNSHGGIVAVCGDRSYSELSAGLVVKNGFYIMLDGIEDPYNFGYAIRSVYASGADGIIVPPRNWMSAAGVVCRASAGASERCRVMISEPDKAADIFAGCGYRVICSDTKDAVPVYESDLTKPLLLIVGGEKRGISRAVLDKATAVVRLDYGRDFPAALSAASAASILAFEVLRQNSAKHL